MAELCVQPTRSDDAEALEQQGSGRSSITLTQDMDAYTFSDEKIGSHVGLVVHPILKVPVCLAYMFDITNVQRSLLRHRG